MEIGLAILLFVCMTALLYVILSLKITRQVDLQMKEFYKTRIHSDIQEFYREMEGYAALMENRIHRFKSLVERTDIAPPTPNASLNGKGPAKKESPRATLHEKKITKQDTPAKKSKPLKEGTVTKHTPVQETKAPSQKKAQVRTQDRPPASHTKKDKTTSSHKTRSPSHTAAPIATESISDDTTIAEELLKDIFAKEAAPAPTVLPNEAKARSDEKPSGETGGEKKPNFFAAIGRKVSPFVFGSEQKTPPAASPTVAAPNVQSNTTDLPRISKVLSEQEKSFSEVLRQAEMIKAQKKAERERAAVEAKAEFYSSGDSFETKERLPRESQLQTPLQRREPLNAPDVRNNLAVKTLDDSTLRFLIQSLVKNDGYRHQALRVLTENNVSLEEISKLSKIEMGELELMRELRRF